MEDRIGKARARLSVTFNRWRLRQRLLRYGATPLFLGWAVVLMVLARTQLGTFVDETITFPFLFKTREMLHRDPPLHPQLKIFSYDDGSADKLQRADLTIGDWATVLTAIAARRPRLIVIDKVFALLNDPTNDKERALAQIAAIGVPIVVGAYAIEDAGLTYARLDWKKPEYQVSSLLVEPGDAPPDFREYRGWPVYGPHLALQKVFHAGHILYPESGLVSPLIQPEPGIVVPHATLMMERRTWLNGALYVNGIKLPVDAKGRLIVNFSREDAYWGRLNKRLGTAVLRAYAKEPITHVDEGDTVLILPEMYTGSTDFKQTPIGILRGGFILASMLNSVLTNNWIRYVPWMNFETLVAVMIGFLWGSRKSLRFFLGLIGIAAGLIAFGTYLFAYQSTATQIPVHLLAFWGTALIVFADRNMKREREARRVADELNEAAEMAKAFSPDPLPSWDVAQVAAFHQPFSEASGDWFAFCRSPSGRYHHFVLCDVTGHGVQAALMVCICRTVLALYTRDKLSQAAMERADFLALYSRELNSMLHHHGRGRHLLTMLGITFDAETKEAHFMSAGHPPPFLLKSNGKGGKAIKQVVSRSSLLGLTDSFTAKLQVHKLARGDEIITYTDGLPVGHHVRALNQFLREPLADFNRAPASLLDRVWAAEMRKSGKQLDDDVSIVWFRAA